VFIVEYGHAAAAQPEDIDNLLEEFVPWIHDLAPLVPRVRTVLSNQQHSIDGQLISAERKGFSYGREDLHRRETPGTITAEITFSHLVHV
jgi:hypothetical protein